MTRPSDCAKDIANSAGQHRSWLRFPDSSWLTGKWRVWREGSKRHPTEVETVVPRRRTDSPLPRRQWALVENHPVQTEPILHLSKAEGKERLFHRHQDTTAVGQRGENALRLDIAIRSQRRLVILAIGASSFNCGFR